MATWHRVLTKRALLSALGPLAGPRATGTVIATATGADTHLAAFTYGIPIIDGKAVYARMVRVLPNGIVGGVPQNWPVTAAGSEVPVRAVSGGTSGNLPAGTPILWQPFDAAIERRGAVDEDGITGGAAVAGPGTCARVIPYEVIGQGEAAIRNFWAARGEGFPAVCVARVGSDVEEITKVNSALRVHRFRIYVVSARLDGDDERAEELELLLDGIEEKLQGIADVDGEVFSGPPVETGSETREASAPTAHIFSIEARVHYALPRSDVREGDGQSWAPWETTRIRVAAPEQGAQDARTLVDVTAEHE